MKIVNLTPNFEVIDIKQTVLFYIEHFEFSLVMAVPETQDRIEQALAPETEYVYAMMQKDDVQVMFQRTDTIKQDVVFLKGLPIGASVSFYMEVEGMVEFHRTLKNKNLETTELRTTWYGMQEFYVKDLNGYILGFAEMAR